MANHPQVLPLVVPSSEDCIWAAGFFEGEGHIGITTNPQGTYRLFTVVGQKQPAPLEWLAARWGSRVCQYASQHGTHRWNLNGVQACEFLRDVEPWLMAKRSEAQLVLAAYASKGINAECKAALVALRKGE